MMPRRPWKGVLRRLNAGFAMLVAAIMLAAAPPMASAAEPGSPAPSTIAQAMHDMAGSGTASHPLRHAMPAHCLASCLAATAVTNPAAPSALMPPTALHAAPAPVETGALVPHPLPVDPPPPRLS